MRAAPVAALAAAALAPLLAGCLMEEHHRYRYEVTVTSATPLGAVSLLVPVPMGDIAFFPDLPGGAAGWSADAPPSEGTELEGEWFVQPGWSARLEPTSLGTMLRLERARLDDGGGLAYVGILLASEVSPDTLSLAPMDAGQAPVQLAAADGAAPRVEVRLTGEDERIVGYFVGTSSVTGFEQALDTEPPTGWSNATVTLSDL